MGQLKKEQLAGIVAAILLLWGPSLLVSCSSPHETARQQAVLLEQQLAELDERITVVQQALLDTVSLERDLEILRREVNFLKEASTNPLHSLVEQGLGRSVGLISAGVRVDVANRHTRETVRKDIVLSEGSGFIISYEGHIITNYHVLWGLSEHRDVTDVINRGFFDRDLYFSRVVVGHVFMMDGKALVADVLYCSEELDYCLLQLRSEQQNTVDWRPIPLHPATWSDDNDWIRRGERLYAVGFPSASRVGISDRQVVEQILREITASLATDLYRSEDHVFTITQGIASRIVEDAAGFETIQHDALISPGSSGGPLVTGSGHCVGINTLNIDQRYSVAYSLRSIIRDMKNRGIDLVPTHPTATVSDDGQ